LPQLRGFPLAQFFFHQSEPKFDSLRLVLCSLEAEVREAWTTRRFRFLNWNFHVFYFPFWADRLRPSSQIPYPHRVVKVKCHIYREKSWT
jgi:hypothetical protein